MESRVGGSIGGTGLLPTVVAEPIVVGLRGDDQGADVGQGSVGSEAQRERYGAVVGMAIIARDLQSGEHPLTFGDDRAHPGHLTAEAVKGFND